MADACHVCWNGESYDDNVILYCEKCLVPVHQACYGIKKIPKGDWFCKACVKTKADGKKKNAKPPACCLCPVPGGALKPTSKHGKWAHVFCANWLPNTWIHDPDGAFEPIMGVEELPEERFKLTCSVCKKKDAGACVQCHYGQCAVPVHAMCAFRSGAHMEIQTVVGEEGCDYKFYCSKHSKVVQEKRER